MSLRSEAPKIVQIETRYVETDPVNFRHVVQSLTGKNSSTDWIGQNHNNNNNNNNNGVEAAIKGGGVATSSRELVCANIGFNGTIEETLLAASAATSSSSMQMNNVVFFDGFMLPPMEMMPWSFS